MSIAYSEGVFVDSVMQHAKLMRRIISSSVACPAVPYYLPYYLIKRHDFREKLLNMRGVYRFSLKFCLNNFSF